MEFLTMCNQHREIIKVEGKDQEPIQSPHLSQDTAWESGNKQVNITHKRAKRITLSQQMTTRLQWTDKKARKLNPFLTVIFETLPRLDVMNPSTHPQHTDTLYKSQLIKQNKDSCENTRFNWAWQHFSENIWFNSAIKHKIKNIWLWYN